MKYRSTKISHVAYILVSVVCYVFLETVGKKRLKKWKERLSTYSEKVKPKTILCKQKRQNSQKKKVLRLFKIFREFESQKRGDRRFW